MSSACKHVLQHSHGAIMKLLEHGAAGRLPLQQVRIGLSFLSERSQDPNTQLESLGRQCQRYLALRDEVERLGQQGLLFSCFSLCFLWALLLSNFSPELAYSSSNR